MGASFIHPGMMAKAEGDVMQNCLTDHVNMFGAFQFVAESAPKWESNSGRL